LPNLVVILNKVDESASYDQFLPKVPLTGLDGLPDGNFELLQRLLNDKSSKRMTKDKV